MYTKLSKELHDEPTQAKFRRLRVFETTGLPRTDSAEGVRQGGPPENGRDLLLRPACRRHSGGRGGLGADGLGVTQAKRHAGSAAPFQRSGEEAATPSHSLLWTSACGRKQSFNGLVIRRSVVRIHSPAPQIQPVIRPSSTRSRN